MEKLFVPVTLSDYGNRTVYLEVFNETNTFYETRKCPNLKIYSNSDNNSIVHLWKCVNKGELKGIGSGGICGSFCADIQSNSNCVSKVKIMYCKNYSDVCTEGGGICGSYCSSIEDINVSSSNCMTLVIIKNSINYGNVRELGGGIVGRFSNFSNNGATNITKIIIKKCKVFGTITKGSGAICGPDSYPIDTSTIGDTIDGFSLLEIKNNTIYSRCDHKNNSGIFLGNNCDGLSQLGIEKPSIIIEHNIYRKKYKKFSNNNAIVLFRYNKNLKTPEPRT